MTIKERLSRLADEDFLLSEAHQALLWSCVVDQGGSALVDFVKAFQRDAARLKIPLYAVRLTATTAEILHAQWRYSLPADDWAIIAYIGRRAAQRIGARVEWAAEAASVQASVGDLDDRVAAFDPAKWVLVV